MSSGGIFGFITFLTPFWVDFWALGQTRGNGPSAQNGLAREGLNLRSMDYGGSVDTVDICRYFGTGAGYIGSAARLRLMDYGGF